MRRLFLSLAAAAIAFGVPALAASPVSASTLTMGCNVQPSAHDTFPLGCGTGYVSQNYTVDFAVSGQTGTDTYAWTPPAYFPIVSGCTSTSTYCIIRAYEGAGLLRGSVVVTQGGVQTDFSATAMVPQVCDGVLC